MQKLIQPINQAKLTASMAITKNTAYYKRFGFLHYGVDFVSTNGRQYLYGLGDGVVTFAGKDSVCGNVIGVVYRDAYNHRVGTSNDITMRYFHLENISVKAGDKVTIDTLLGHYGNTGKYSTAAHLHVEADRDTVYTQYTPTIAKGSVLRGTSQRAVANTIVNPLDYFYTKTTTPENQTYTTANDSYINQTDKTIPIL